MEDYEDIGRPTDLVRIIPEPERIMKIANPVGNLIELEEKIGTDEPIQVKWDYEKMKKVYDEIRKSNKFMMWDYYLKTE